MPNHEYYLTQALKEAKKAEDVDDVPIGAIIVKDDTIIARGHNTKETQNDPSGHAELNAIRSAATQLGNWRLDGCTLYSTLEPCPMCAGAILQSRLDTVVYGATDHKWGGHVTKLKCFEEGLFNHTVEVIHLANSDCSTILSEYFKKKRT